MKYLVGFNGSPQARRALALACEQANLVGAKINVVYSLVGGIKESAGEIHRTEELLESVRTFMSKLDLDYEVFQMARGLTPGKDLVRFADENDIDHIFIGVEKISRTSKLIMGSTARYVILNGSCPVTTTK